MNEISILLFGTGLAAMIVGAEVLVRNAARLASDIGIPAVVVGLTIVGFGTSAPELAISLEAALRGEADLAVGNVIGSNIANILLIVGLAAAILPLSIAPRLVQQEMPIVIGVSLLFTLFALNGSVARWEGAILALLMAGYLVFVVRQSRRVPHRIEHEYEEAFGRDQPRTARLIVLRLLLVIAGLAMIVLGADWLVDGASSMARSLGVSELVIGLTIVAVGTSAPELVTSLVAALRGERDIAVGNAVGSNIFNLLFVLGLTALAVPDRVPIAPAALAFDIPFMVLITVAALPIMLTGFRVARWEGLLFLSYYAAYIAYQLLATTDAAAADNFSFALFAFVTPLTAVALIAAVVAEMRRHRRQAQTLPGSDG